jgi:hypothetical protein
MATREILERLARVNPGSLDIHLSVKKLMPEEEANLLCYANFVDCSDEDLNQPSYYYDKDWDDCPIPLILVNEEVDQYFKPIDGKVTYSILLNNPGGKIKYKHCQTVENAIETYLIFAGLFK